MILGEDKVIQIFDELQEKGRFVPRTVAEIPRLPFESFSELTKAFELDIVRMQRLVYAMEPGFFDFFATAFERLRLPIYSTSMFTVPVVAIALGYFVSWWCLLVVLLIPVTMTMTKKLYNKVIYRAAFSSEKIFCFLYFVGQISVVTSDYKTSYFWVRDDRDDEGDESVLRNARASALVQSSMLSQQHTSLTPVDDSAPDSRAKHSPRHQEEKPKAILSGIDSENITQTIKGLVEQDIADIAAGRIVKRRLIPHHAIKRDIILRAFAKDFFKLSPSMQDLNREHYEGQIAEITQWNVDELDRMLGVMARERTDLAELERQARSEQSLYSIVAPLFMTSTSDAR